MNSYCNACKPGLATWVVVAILITAPKSSVYRNFLIFSFRLPSIRLGARLHSAGQEG